MHLKTAIRLAEAGMLTMRLCNANAVPHMRGESRLETVRNHISRGKPVRTGLANYREVFYGNVYAGIDLRWHGKQQAIDGKRSNVLRVAVK